MNQVTENLGLNIGGITDEPSLIPNMVTNLVKLDQAIGQGSADQVARAAAAAAQADATQALTDAAAAEATAEAAATVAAAGLKVKQLSRTEIDEALNFATGEGSFASLVSTLSPNGYVINVTPRIKIVFMSQSYTEKVIGETANKTLALRALMAQPSWVVRGLHIVPSVGTVNIAKNNPLSIITETSSTPTDKTNYKISFIGVLLYASDTDLGTDID